MNNPQLYVLVGEGDSVQDWHVLSNLDWGKTQAVKTLESTRLKQTIYKLVPVYEADLETTTKIVEKVFEEQSK